MNFTFRDIKIKIANSYITSSISITFVLLTLGFFALLLLNTRDLSKSAKEHIIVTIILKPDAEKGTIDAFKRTISAKKYCKEARLISPEEALDELKVTLGEDIGDILDYNPLPTTINLNLNEKFSNSDSLQVIKTALMQSNIVDDVFYNDTMVYQLDKNIRKLSLSVAILEFFLLLMAISLISNTIRLLIHSKRFEIKTMQLVGATSFFIIKPFLIKSILHGLISSLLAIALIIIGILYYQNNVEDIVQIGHLEAVFGIILLAGLVITSLATYLSVTSYLSSNQDDLHF